MISDYENLYLIDSFKNKVRAKKIQVCTNYIAKEKLSYEENSKNIFSRIFYLAKKNDSSEALLCLRCRVSNPIKNSIGNLYKKHSAIYEIDYLDMMKYVLDDYGENLLKVSSNSTKKVKVNERSFRWSNVIKVEKNKLRPFGVRVLIDFNSELSNIDTWTYHKVRSNPELKSYLKSFGLNLIRTWPLIAEQSTSRVKEAWRLYGNNSMNNNEIENLHKSFVEKYKKAKSEYKRTRKRIIGWEPDFKFLQSLKPKQVNRDNLEMIDKAIRKFKSSSEGAPQNFMPFEELRSDELFKNDLYTLDSNIEKESTEKEIDIIQKTIQESTFLILKSLISSEKNKWKENDDRRLAWKLYAEGLSQRDIAVKCNHKQGWVSKLIKEKIILERIASLAAIKLKDYPAFESLKKEPDKIDNLIMQLQIYLVSKDPESGNSILRSILQEVIDK